MNKAIYRFVVVLKQQQTRPVSRHSQAYPEKELGGKEAIL